MQYSRSGDALTKGFEACHLHAYPDPASPLARALQARGLWQQVLSGEPVPETLAGLAGDPWTCGWGETGPDIRRGTVWTQTYADSRLAAREAHCAAVVNSLVGVPLTQGEFDALCDFVFNAGAGAFKGSTLLRLLNCHDYAGAAAEFERWDIAGGRHLAGLLRRRRAEEAMFTGQAPQ